MIENSVWRTGDGEHRDTHAHFPSPGCSPVPCPHFLPSPPPTSSPTAPALHGDRMSSPEPQRCCSQPEKPPIISCQYLWGSLSPGISQPLQPLKTAPSTHMGGGGGSLQHPVLSKTPAEKSQRDLGHTERCAEQLCAALLLQSFAMCSFACWKTA